MRELHAEIPRKDFPIRRCSQRGGSGQQRWRGSRGEQQEMESGRRQILVPRVSWALDEVVKTLPFTLKEQGTRAGFQVED